MITLSHLGNDGGSLLLLIAADPPQAVVDFFCKIDLQRRLGPQFSNDGIQALLVVVSAFTRLIR